MKSGEPPAELPAPKSASYFGNFLDPIGLAKRMLFSGNRAAYWSLGREIARPFIFPFDWMMQRSEKKKLASAGDLQYPLLLVVGPPRGGTTVLYQVLAHALDATWLPNLSELFPRSPITATSWFARLPRKRTGLSSFYGQTAGMSAPNDGFHVWNRWFGQDRYEPKIEADSIASVRRFMAAWTNTFEKPLVNKNNRNSLCIEQLAEVLPTAHFVVADRDASDIARSLVRSREFVQGAKDRPWGLISRTHEAGDELSYIDDVCDQIIEIRRRIAAELSGMGADRFTGVSYEELCSAPVKTIQKISQRSGVAIRESAIDSLPELRSPTRRPLSDAEEQRLTECLKDFDRTPTGETTREPV